MATSLTLTCTLGTPVVPVTGQARLVYVLVEIDGGAKGQALPVNLGLVLDCSDSMRIHMVTDEQFAQLARSGQAVEVVTDGVPAWQIADISPEQAVSFPCKLDYVCDSLVIAGEHLRPSDRFAVVAFAGQAVTVVPASSGSSRHLLGQAAAKLDLLNLGDETQIAEGLALGFEAMRTGLPPGEACRLILLTDGYTRNVSQCYAWAQQAREQGMVLSTMGIGAEFNEELLIPLAEATGGNAYFIESPQSLPDAFRQELGAALAVLCRNLEVKLKLAQGVELRRVHRVLPMIGAFEAGPNVAGSYSFYLADYDPAAPPALLLELVLPDWDAGQYRLAQCLLAWDDPAGGLVRGNDRQDVVVQVSAAGAGPPNGRVMNVAEKVGAFKLGTRALEGVAQGDPAEALARLRQAATRLLDMGETRLAGEMERQAVLLERDGQLDPNATKRLRYETRKLTQKLAD